MNLKLYLKRSSPTILSIMACVGVVGASYLSAKASPKAIRLMKEMRDLKGEDLTILEKFKLAAPVYIPATAVGLGTIGCILASNTLSRRQQAALTSAYALLDSAYKEYRSKVQQTIGKDKSDDIMSEIVKENCKNAPKPEDEEVLFWDSLSRRYFNRTMAQVIEAEYLLNRQFVLKGYVTLNDFYELLKLNPTVGGSVIGWSLGAGFELYGYEWIDFEHNLVKTDDGLECYILNLPFEPTADFLDV